MVAVPAVGTVSPSSALMLVVFPDPFGPRNAVMRPGWTSTERSSTAVSVRYRFVRCVKEMVTGGSSPSVEGGRADGGSLLCGRGARRECQTHVTGGQPHRPRSGSPAAGGPALN